MMKNSKNNKTLVQLAIVDGESKIERVDTWKEVRAIPIDAPKQITAYVVQQDWDDALAANTPNGANAYILGENHDHECTPVQFYKIIKKR